MTDLSDVQVVRIPAQWSAEEFTQRVLSGVPSWLVRLLDFRDLVVSRFGFETQHKPDVVRVSEGAKAGPFVIKGVTSDAVRAGNEDRHIKFETTFSTALTSNGDSLGVMATTAGGRSLFGRLYLSLIWPGHLFLMPIVLRSAVRTSRRALDE